MNKLKANLGKWIFEREIWQISLLDESGIDSFASHRGTSSFFLGDHIRILWQLGLLNADLIKSPNVINVNGLQYLDKDSLNNNCYADLREHVFRPEGWVDSAKNMDKLEKSVDLFFHPFRYYILYNLDRVLKLGYVPIQALINSEGYPSIIKGNIESVRSVTSRREFTQDLDFWNEATMLCIALEPCFHTLLFNQLRYSPDESYEEQQKNILLYWYEMEPILHEIGLDYIEKIRQDLCVSAEFLDRNKDVHTLLRLTRGEKRFTKITGKLGGAMVLLTMAEILRRAAEKVFKIKLKEEDELGFGMWVSGAKENIYGTDRVADGNAAVKTQWLRTFGLETGTRLKWYVEGETEFYAIDSAIVGFDAIEIINLRGKVVEKNAISFRDNLINDTKASRFSIISIDGDRSDYLGVVRKAAEDDNFCGIFFVSESDFEFQNFTFIELEEILINFCENERPDLIINKNEFHKALENAQNADQLIAKARSFTQNPSVKKGAEWGLKLMQYAQMNPELEKDTGEREERQIIKAIRMAIRMCSSNFLSSRRDYKTDSKTGTFVKRDVP